MTPDVQPWSLINIFYSPISVIDGLLAIYCPPFFRVIVWALVAGTVVMAVYRLLSNQEQIRQKKSKIKDLRREILSLPSDRHDEMLRLSLQNLKLSMGLLRIVTFPALLSAFPVVVIVFWLSAHYSFVQPQLGEPITFTVVPESLVVSTNQPGQVSQSADEWLLLWPSIGQPITLLDESGIVYHGDITTPPAIELHKWQLWNWLLGNPAGYIEQNTSLEHINFDLHRYQLWPGVPEWMATWEAPFFLFITVWAIFLKVVFRIE